MHMHLHSHVPPHHSIPMRNEYSDRIRTKLWSGNVEMCKTVGKKGWGNDEYIISSILEMFLLTIISLSCSFSLFTKHPCITMIDFYLPNEIERNLAEFAAEDYNWRGACQEEEMYICGDTKERIHPVHIELGHYTFGTGGGICCQRSYYYGM